MNISKLLFCSAALIAALTIAPNLGAQATAAAPAKKSATKPAAKAPPTDAEIADAKAKGMVWANKNTKVYHKADAALYGKTKNGEFLSEADAQKAGYKAAQEPHAKVVKKAAKTATAQ